MKLIDDGETIKPLKEFYGENQIKFPKNLLPRELWLYSQYCEKNKETTLLSESLLIQKERSDDVLTIKQDDIAKLKKSLFWLHTKTWAECSFFFGVGLGFVVLVTCLFSHHGKTANFTEIYVNDRTINGVAPRNY